MSFLLEDEKLLDPVIQKRLMGLRTRNKEYKKYAGMYQAQNQARAFEAQLLRDARRAAAKLDQFAWEIAHDSDDMSREAMRTYAQKLRVGLGLEK
jgi:hypothetical protein